jgi:hypothetical protein
MIDGIPVSTLTPLGLLCLVLAFPYLQLARGKLHPQSTIDRMVAAHNRELEDISHDRGEWRTAHRISETARLEAVGQVHELLEHARTTDQFIRSLPSPQRGAS